MSVSRSFSIGFNITTTCHSLIVAWTCTYVLLLPVFLFILCVGFQQCRKPRPRPSATPHSDVFTFNMAALEVIGILSSCLSHLAFVTDDYDLLILALSLGYVMTFGQMFLHVLLCLERYLAVVHPITYLRLKKRGVAIRNISIALVWLLSFVISSMYHLFSMYWLTVFITAVLSLAPVTFFCVSVLYVLIRPGPGERGGDRKHVDQSKRRAFYIIAAVTVALMLKFGMMFYTYMIILTNESDAVRDCLLAAAAPWMNLPSSLVMPTLFLYRRVKQRKVNPQIPQR